MYCKICNKPTRNYGGKRGYNKYCSRKCSNSDPEIKLKSITAFKKTCLEKYGVDNVSKVNSIKEKRTVTFMNKYGVENPFQAEEVKVRIKQNNLERYGVENIAQLKEVRDKAKQTNLIRYGTKNPMLNEGVRKKLRESCIAKYGVDNPCKNKEVVNKIKATNLSRYGVECSLLNENIKKKGRSTCMNKYGVDCYSKTREYRIKHRQRHYELNKKVWPEIVKMFEGEGYTVITIPETYRSTIIEFICPNGHEHYTYMGNWRRGDRCGKCNRNSISTPEREIYEFLQDKVDSEVELNTRKVITPRELDIYLPQYNLAVEYNGLRWHSETHGCGKDFHLNKTEACESKGIQLIHIFEDEWLYKRDIVKSMLLSKLGIYDRRLYARQCEMKMVAGCIKDEFLDSNHIQGSCKSSLNIGLYYNDALVTLMTFGRRRISSRVNYEMLRYCTLLNTQVVGGASKLFSYITNNTTLDNVISYADRRWSGGNLYDIMGFAYDHTSKPGYYYTKGYNRMSRLRFKKHKLAGILDNFNPDLTEYENMNNNGYSRIWDCGNMVYLWSRN